MGEKVDLYLGFHLKHLFFLVYTVCLCVCLCIYELRKCNPALIV